MQTETTRSYHFPPARVVTKSQVNESWRGWVELAPSRAVSLQAGRSWAESQRAGSSVGAQGWGTAVDPGFLFRV